jgi:hypothetical protein
MWGPSRPESKPANPSPLSPALKTEEPSLSDLNPLFHPVELFNPPSVETFKNVTLGLIDKYGGLNPDVMKAIVVPSNNDGVKPEFRFIARFEVKGLTKKKIGYLEELVKYTYGSDAKTTKNSEGVPFPAMNYPHADTRSVDDILNSRLEGWYMGPNTTPLDTLHQGLYLFRDVGITNTKNFLKTTPAKKPKYRVEIREASLYQTDLANLIVETASILGKGMPVDYGKLLYDSYYSLMRVGLKKEEEGYEIDEILRPVLNGLVLPLANPRLADAIDQKPESALLCGVPGTGKSLAAKQLFYRDTGTFIIPMDPMLVVAEVATPPEKRKVLPRISQIRSLSQKPVILQLEDVENLFTDDNKDSSALLNLMAGVQEHGFYVLASTNEPERIDDALLQPQRLGVRVYCGLPQVQARLKMLDMHTPMFTPEGNPLFSTPEARGLILKLIAENTNNFPPRQLSKIATNAKSILLERVVSKSGKAYGLSEENLNGHTFTVDDWEEALLSTLKTFDIKATEKRDQEIRKFVIQNEQKQSSLGFARLTNAQTSTFDEVRRKIAALDKNPISA